ncbi:MULTISPECIES: GTP cyclohydrolase FolE2 [Neptuniibacter]|jgi:GTP cyclohydrolase I|uniref:GTP cyclohydrolase FolE2 n=1 Tax=Neptuniibacter TaxID=459520 RepID=UPI000834F4E7|nr:MULTISPECIES: GTP cyclohydrolase FolE2 [Neptuniibacter]MDO6514013.1 GTP cyclohydrolase FolE2 [Neptuniibacter sp. 2_MG-2023]MDO6594145.1 GTP cyclohydrolase FolE2 [Neptuniibacter sp. 1_MG-2023]
MTNLPDVTSNQNPEIHGSLDWVGMNGITVPLQFEDNKLGVNNIEARVNTYVNLVNPKVKGIHMSRLYLALSNFFENQTLNVPALTEFLSHLLDSHHDISTQVFLNFEFDFLIKRDALKSDNSGWKNYSTTLRATLTGNDVVLELATRVPYSSTCPCSAALSRQLLQQAFTADFSDKGALNIEDVEKWLLSEKGSFATPHSQRSQATAWVKLNKEMGAFPLTDLIDLVEGALKTPVQTAVKRADEQEFARLNGHNLMFCEDSARRLKQALNSQTQYSDFWLKVEHFESLHAHDAVALASKGVEGGYSPANYT